MPSCSSTIIIQYSIGYALAINIVIKEKLLSVSKNNHLEISNNTSQFKYLSEIPYDTTCKSLNFNSKFASSICIGKIDIFCKI